MIKQKPRRRYDLKSGESLVVVSRQEPGGVFTKTWYSLDSNCKGCEHSCGLASPITHLSMIDAALKRRKHDILRCKSRTRKGRMYVHDFREKQQGMEVFL